MSYQRRAKDRQRALKARYGTNGGEEAPTPHHRETPHRAHVERDRKQCAKRGYIKHKQRGIEQ